MALKQLYANNAATLLIQPLGGTVNDKILYVDSAQAELFPSPDPLKEYFLVTLEDPETKEFEIVKVQQRTGNTFILAARGEEGTTVRAFNIGAKVQLRVTKNTLENIYNHADEIASYVHKQKTTPGQSGSKYVWIVNHNLNRYPSVVIEEGTWGTNDVFIKTADVEADIKYVDNLNNPSKTELRIEFSEPIIGRAICT